jgi:hypothetical protein
MFDEAMTLQTSQAVEIVAEITPSGFADTLALFNIDAASVHLTVTSTSLGVVYDATTSLFNSEGRDTWWNYFFLPVEYYPDYLLQVSPPVNDAVWELTLSRSSGNVLCGEAVTGLSQQLGITILGGNTGLDDYSIVEADAFGNYTVTERPFAFFGGYDVWVEVARAGYVRRQLASRRAQKTLWFVDADFPETLLYGFPKNVLMSKTYANYHVLNLELRGLT